MQKNRLLFVLVTGVLLSPGAGAASAQVPPDVEAKLVTIGRVVDAPGTAQIPLLVTAAELDPERTVELSHMLNDQLCAAGHCPKYQLNKGQSHMSQVMGINSADTSVSAPIFAWIKAVK